jgi:hypothetical protein
VVLIVAIIREGIFILLATNVVGHEDRAGLAIRQTRQSAYEEKGAYKSQK